jgi:hypothetical protein
MPDDAQPKLAEDEDGEFVDFDEATEKPKRFRVKGRFYTLPVDPPAAPILKAVREGRVNEGDPEELLKLMLPAQDVAQMFDDGVGLVQMGELAKWLATKVFKFAKVAEGEADPGTPPSASATSSNGGRRSRRTSGASTKQTR